MSHLGTTGTVQGSGGATLRTVSWPVDRPKGRVQLVHGLSEHMGRYDLLANALNQAGYSAYGHDHRGHGGSDGRRGVGATVPELAEDLHTLHLLADELAPGPGSPFLIAHSMGGLVAIRYLQVHREALGAAPLSGVVVSAPWLATRARIPLLKRLALPLIRQVAPQWPIPQPIQPLRLTRDEEIARIYANDPLVVRALSVSFFDAVQRAQKKALDQGLPSDIPLVMIAPEADELTDTDLAVDWAGSRGMEVWSLPETRHEPFNEINRNKTFERLVEWLDHQRDRWPKEKE